MSGYESGQKVDTTTIKFEVIPENVDGQKIPWDELGVNIDGPAQVSDLSLDEINGKVFLSFKTDTTGPYTVSIQHNNADIAKSPLTVHVHRPGQKPAPPPEPAPPPPSDPRRPIRFKVPNAGGHTNAWKVYLAEGPEQPSETKLETQGSDLWVTILIQTPGTYKVGVRNHQGQDITNSPFSINVPNEAFQKRS